MIQMSRSLNESIVINDEIVISVVEIRFDKVLLKIEAQGCKELKVDRSYNRLSVTIDFTSGKQTKK